MTERLHFHFSLSCIGEGNGNPLRCSCLENPRDGGAWWAAVSGVAQSQTRLKRLSSSSSGKVVMMLELPIYRESMITTLPKQIFPSEEVLTGDSFTVGKQWCISHGDDEIFIQFLLSYILPVEE